MSEFLHVGVSTLEWAVYCVVGEIKKEWLILLSLDEIDGFTGKGIREIG